MSGEVANTIKLVINDFIYGLKTVILVLENIPKQKKNIALSLNAQFDLPVSCIILVCIFLLKNTLLLMLNTYDKNLLYLIRIKKLS